MTAVAFLAGFVGVTGVVGVAVGSWGAWQDYRRRREIVAYKKRAYERRFGPDNGHAIAPSSERGNGSSGEAK